MAILIIYNQILRYISWSTIDKTLQNLSNGIYNICLFHADLRPLPKTYGRKEMDYD